MHTLGSVAFPFIWGVPPIELWDRLSTYVYPGIACLSSQSSDWLAALWASLSGVQSSMTFVRLNVIGHCLVGMFNCPASTHWLIDCALAQLEVQHRHFFKGYRPNIPIK